MPVGQDEHGTPITLHEISTAEPRTGIDGIDEAAAAFQRELDAEDFEDGRDPEIDADIARHIRDPKGAAREDAEAAEAPEAEANADSEAEADGAEADETTADSDTDEDGNELYAVRVNGEDHQVTLDELRAGYSRTQDYTRKTQELAEGRRALESQQAQAVQNAHTPQVALEAYGRTFENHLTPELRGQMERDYTAAIQAQQVAQAEQLQAYAADEREALLEAIPAWKDPAVAKAESAEVAEYARSMGFTAQELEQMVDHRGILAIRKAMLYDQMADVQAEVRTKAKAAKVIQPGSRKRTPPNATQRKARAERAAKLAKSGSIDDAAAVFRDILGDE